MGNPVTTQPIDHRDPTPSIASEAGGPDHLGEIPVLRKDHVLVVNNDEVIRSLVRDGLNRRAPRSAVCPTERARSARSQTTRPISSSST